MNKPLALILILAVAMPLVGCLDAPPRNNTVFHQTDQNPRSGPTKRNPRYGHGGTHSPGDPEYGRSASRNRPPADPDGIVKPRDLDNPAVGVDPQGNPSTDVPGGETTGPTVDPEKDDPVASAPGGKPPYAEAVPGKYGLVWSPFVKNKKDALVNVTDENNVPLPPGTEVTCPHTQKIFRVP